MAAIVAEVTRRTWFSYFHRRFLSPAIGAADRHAILMGHPPLEHGEQPPHQQPSRDQATQDQDGEKLGLGRWLVHASTR
jgi:hypothetical protein